MIKNTAKNHHLIWIDLEMTGLDPEQNTILEIATIVTNNNLDILAEGPNIAIAQKRDPLEIMDDWNTKQHQKSGLVTRVHKSTIDTKEAESLTLNFLKEWTQANTSPMCGNSIHTDRVFLKKYMPTLEKYFHYRHIDVSTIKELAKRWFPSWQSPKKESDHLALNDIHDSIKELQSYREQLFIQPIQSAV